MQKHLFNITSITTKLSLLLLTACATSSFFTPYNQQAASFRQAIADNTVHSMAEKLKKKYKSADNLLYMQEAGRLNQLDKRYDASLKNFNKVIKRYRQEDDRALVSVTDVGSKSLSLFGNENSIPYQGAPYERILTHQFQAFNYLMEGNITAASVEVRRGSNEQRRMELQQAKALAKAEQKARRNSINLSVIKQDPHLAGINDLTGKIKSSFLNAYTYYTNAVIWESQGKWNDALVDYKKAYEINSDNKQIYRDIVRVQERQLLNDQGALVVLFEQGFVAERQSFNLSVPSFSFDHFISVALPYYDIGRWPETSYLTIEHGLQIHKTQILANISQLAAKSLKEQYPALIVRQVLRVIAKRQLQSELSKTSDIGGIFANIYSIVSEQADLRSWSTLPHTAQTSRLLLLPGKQRIKLNYGKLSESRDILINKGRITVMRVIDAKTHLIIEVANL